MLRILSLSWLTASCASLLLACALAQPGSAPSAILTTNDLSDVPKLLSQPVGARTLLVLDVDDTLLTSAGFFGSDRWYEWQRTLSPSSPGYVPCRFDMLALNYESGTQISTQADAATIINSILADKIILTARSELYRGATIRELQQAGYELPRALAASSSGLSYEWRGHGQAAPVFVGYRDGVFMVSGHDKGILLLDLLRRLDLSYKRIVLVDDSEKNILAMRDALASAGIAYLGLHYRRIGKTVDSEDVEAGIAGWHAWQRLLSATYPQRLQRLLQNDCAY
jgi:hypothetical protein